MATNKFEREIQKILENKISPQLSKEQTKTLQKFAEHYGARKSSKGGHIKRSSVWNNLLTLRQLGLHLGKPYEQAIKKDLIDFFVVRNKDKSEATISSWKVVIRSFYKWMHGVKKKHEFPEIVDDDRLEPTRAEPRKVSPSDLFTKDEVLRMIKVCRNPQDKAIVQMWWEMGPRAKEYISANVGSVEFVSGGCKFYVEESKTESGFIPLVQSAPYLQEWLHVHPYKDDPKAPLFIGMSAYYGQRMQPNGINQKLKRIAKRAGIKKRIFTHLGRNISITRLDGTISVEDNARLHGITSDTVLRVYTRRTRKEACQKYFDISGRKKTDEELAAEQKEEEKLLPKVCENCGTSNPYDRNFCTQCLRPVDMQTFLMLENKRDFENKVIQRIPDSQTRIGLSKKDLKAALREMIRDGEITL